MDSQQFALARGRAMERERGGIGTLGEKTLHAVLKYYYEPCELLHEVRVGPYVADIKGEDGIIEIQTAGFDRLRQKLPVLLEQGPVTVVYPVPALKWLIWVDPDTGEATSRRKSPKRAKPCEILTELYRIKPLLTHPRLTLRVPLLELEETRSLSGWSVDRKRGSSRCDRMPLSLFGEVVIRRPEDYAALLPEGLPLPFTSRDFHKAAGMSLSRAQTALHVLHFVGAVQRTGRSREGFFYAPVGAGV